MKEDDIAFLDVTLLYVGVNIVRMAKSRGILEKAWQQLGVENPESIFRLRKLKAEQKTNDDEQEENYLPHPQILASSNHIELIFKELTDPGFSSKFGDVTLVFKDGNSVPYYKSILSLVSIEFRMLLQLYTNTDLVILTGISKEEFFGEAFKVDDVFSEPHIFDKIDKIQITQNQHKNKEILEQTSNIDKVRKKCTSKVPCS